MKRQRESATTDATQAELANIQSTIDAWEKHPNNFEALYQCINAIHHFYLQHCTSTQVATIMQKLLQGTILPTHFRAQVPTYKIMRSMTQHYLKVLRQNKVTSKYSDPAAQLATQIDQYTDLFEHIIELFESGVNTTHKCSALTFLNAFRKACKTPEDHIIECIIQKQVAPLLLIQSQFNKCFEAGGQFFEFLRHNSNENVITLYFHDIMGNLKKLTKMIDPVIDHQQENLKPNTFNAGRI